MIPRRIMFFWGNDKMSWMRYKTLESFRRLNPDWEMTLYTIPQLIYKNTWDTHEMQDYQYYDGEDYMPQVSELDVDIREWQMPEEVKELFETYEIGASHMSNLFKWFELSREGGIYSDMDILYIRPFDEFYDKFKNFETVLTHNNYFSIGLLGGRESKFYKDVYLMTLNSIDLCVYQSAGVVAIYKLLGVSVQDSFKKLSTLYDGVYNFDFGEIYPYDSTNIQDAFTENYIIPKSTAFHWYAGHPESQKYNCLLNDKNYKDYNILFSKLLNHE